MPTKLILYLIGSGAVLALLGGAVLKIRHDEAERWRPKVEAAQQATKNAEAVSSALDGLQTKTVIIREKADVAIREVQQAPGADTLVPPDVLDAWRRGLQHDSASGNPDDPGKP